MTKAKFNDISDLLSMDMAELANEFGDTHEEALKKVDAVVAKNSVAVMEVVNNSIPGSNMGLEDTEFELPDIKTFSIFWQVKTDMIKMLSSKYKVSIKDITLYNDDFWSGGWYHGIVFLSDWRSLPFVNDILFSKLTDGIDIREVTTMTFLKGWKFFMLSLQWVDSEEHRMIIRFDENQVPQMLDSPFPYWDNHHLRNLDYIKSQVRPFLPLNILDVKRLNTNDANKEYPYMWAFEMQTHTVPFVWTQVFKEYNWREIIDVLNIQWFWPYFSCILKLKWGYSADVIIYKPQASLEYEIRDRNITN